MEGGVAGDRDVETERRVGLSVVADVTGQGTSRGGETIAGGRGGEGGREGGREG
jgi:hypothetical protein